MAASTAQILLYGASHPSRVRGLKYATAASNDNVSVVAPFTGAWIEIGVSGYTSGKI